MANDVTICVIGNLTDAPELRFLPNGHAVVTRELDPAHRTDERARLAGA